MTRIWNAVAAVSKANEFLFESLSFWKRVGVRALAQTTTTTSLRASAGNPSQIPGSISGGEELTGGPSR
jgi:hypothetical protein